MGRKIAVSTGSVTPKCEPLTSAICKGLGYNLTQLQNKLQHNTSHQASSALSALLAKLQSNCSPHLIPFLCQLYLPPCVLPQAAAPPCRSLCASVQEDCSLVSPMDSWPGHLSCERFPRANDKPECFLGSTKVTTKRTALIRGSEEGWLTETNSLKPEKGYPTKRVPSTKHVPSTTAPTYRSTSGQQRNKTTEQQRNETRNENTTITSLPQSNFTTRWPSPSEAGLFKYM